MTRYCKQGDSEDDALLTSRGPRFVEGQRLGWPNILRYFKICNTLGGTLDSVLGGARTVARFNIRTPECFYV